jgi:hypothetical protein
MTRPRFQTPQLQFMYDACLRLAADNFSEFYYSKPLARGDVGPGPRWPHEGATHRHHFWNGYKGARATHVQGSLVHAAYEAGRQFRRERSK